jgi:hypothetical protein
MNMETARLTVLACADESLGSAKSESYAKDEEWLDQQISGLLQRATEANPTGNNLEAEHEAVSQFAITLMTQLALEAQRN